MKHYTMCDDEQYAFDPTPPFGMDPAITTCEPRSRSNRWLVSQQPSNACSRVDTAGTLLVPSCLRDDDHLTGCLTSGPAMIVRSFGYQRPSARLHTRRRSQSLYYLVERISRAAQSKSSALYRVKYWLIPHSPIALVPRMTNAAAKCAHILIVGRRADLKDA
jgi:hypothetical protein